MRGRGRLNKDLFSFYSTDIMNKSNKIVNWSKEEVQIIVSDYFDMMHNELQGRKYNKSEHRRKIIKLLNNRSHGSIERKHQNISAALIDVGLPYIQGYKPLRNFQKSQLPDAIQKQLGISPDFLSLIAKDVESSIDIPDVADILQSMVEPPFTKNPLTESIKETINPYSSQGVNYLAREANNRAIGNIGEKFALNYERARLMFIGKNKLANKIEQVSVTVGDHAGFDIHSYEKDGTDRFIEVKSTKYGKETPFFISANEVDFSKNYSDKYYLYRVFSLRQAPKLFHFKGPVQAYCNLKATQFIGRF